MATHHTDYLCTDVLGNAFVLMDHRDKTHCQFNQTDVKAMAQSGIVFDQLLLLEAPLADDCLASLRIFNVDGSVAQHCGNGLICIARYLRQLGHLKHEGQIALGERKITIGTNTSQDYVYFDLPQILSPFTQAACRPLYARYPQLATTQPMRIDVGNQHVILTSDTALDLEWIARTIPDSDAWNVHHLQPIDTNTIRLRSYERGCGYTLACGSGSVAAAFVHGQTFNHPGRITIQQAQGACYVDPDKHLFRLVCT